MVVLEPNTEIVTVMSSSMRRLAIAFLLASAAALVSSVGGHAVDTAISASIVQRSNAYIQYRDGR